MSLKREVHTRGVVITRRGAGEGSVRALVYTEACGLVRAALTSGREERSQLRPYLLPGTIGTFSLVQGKVEWRITGAFQCQITMYAVRLPEARVVAERILELVRRFVHGEERNDALFEALSSFFYTLPNITTSDCEALEHLAAVRLLAALGYVESRELGDILAAPYMQRISEAHERRAELVRHINHGFEVSGI